MDDKKPAEKQDELTIEDLEKVSAGDGNWGAALTLKPPSPLGIETEDSWNALKPLTKFPH